MTFQDFIDRLRSEKKLTEIHEPVSPVLEACAIAKEKPGPLLFQDIAGARVAMNLLSSRSLLAEALGFPGNKIIKHLAGIEPRGKVTIVEDSPTMEVMGEPDLGKLPILTHFEKDSAPYITAGVVVTEYEGILNASVHRLMVLGKHKLAARLVEHRHTYNLHKKASEMGERLPIAIAIGIDPVTLLAVCTRVPEGLEFEYASALAGKPLEVFQCENGIKVPHAEIVLEGYIDPIERSQEGPFVDITGTYDVVRQEPVIYLTGMMHVRNPIYHAIMPGSMEHKILMGVPYEPLIYKAVKEAGVEIRNVFLTEGGCCYFHAVIQIKKKEEEDGKKSIDAAFAAHQSLKHVMVVDEDIDIFDPRDVEYAVATRVKGDEDIYVYPNTRGSSLDPRSSNGIGTKVGIDATIDLSKPWKFERARVKNKRVDL